MVDTTNHWGLQQNGMRVISVTEPSFDVNTVMGMWMQKVTVAKNASYSMEVAFHTRKGMRQNTSARDEATGYAFKNGGRATGVSVSIGLNGPTAVGNHDSRLSGA
jgi:hypothetical protein